MRQKHYLEAAARQLHDSCPGPGPLSPVREGREGRRAAAAAVGSLLLPHESPSPFQLGLQFVTR